MLISTLENWEMLTWYILYSLKISCPFIKCHGEVLSSETNDSILNEFRRPTTPSVSQGPKDGYDFYF